MCGRPKRKNPLYGKFFFFSFLIINTRYGFLTGIKGSIYISKSYRILFISFSLTHSGLCKYHVLVKSIFNFLHYSQWITVPIDPTLVLLLTKILHFGYVISRFISLLTKPKFAILLHIIDFRLNIIGPNGIFFSLKEIQLFSKDFSFEAMSSYFCI